MQLTATNVDNVFKDCLLQEEEIVDGIPPHIAVEGIIRLFGFHPERLESHREEVKELLLQLSEDFLESKGGGASFLNACMTQKGIQWGEHHNMEQLFALGEGLKLARRVDLGIPASMLPGGMPYFVVLKSD